MPQTISLVVAAAAAAAGQCFVTADAHCHAAFDRFERDFSKSYATEDERESRKEIFCANLATIQQKNGNHGSATFGITRNADQTAEEFAARNSIPQGTDGPWCAPNDVAVDSGSVLPPPTINPATLPDAVDWRQHDPPVLSAINDQGGCNGCYGFSAVETIESTLALATNSSVLALSVQEVLSCNKNNTLGCESGFTECVYKWVQANGGIEPASEFPFTCKGYPKDPTRVPKCMDKAPVAQVSGWHYVLPPCYGDPSKCATYDHSTLLAALAQGPVSTCLDNSDWQHYKGGVLASCQNLGPGHCVQIVGYNTTASEPYLRIRNSFGTEFGEDGYIRIALSDKNECGVADILTLPHVAKL